MLSSGTVVGIRIEAWCDCWRPKATSRLRHPPQPRKVDAAAATHRTSQLVSWAGRMRLSSSCALQLITPVRTPRSCPGSDPCRRPCRWTSLPVPLQNRRSSRPVPASPSCMGTQTACPGGDCLQKQSTPTFQTQQQVASAMQMGLLLPREPRGRITSFSRCAGAWCGVCVGGTARAVCRAEGSYRKGSRARRRPRVLCRLAPELGALGWLGSGALGRAIAQAYRLTRTSALMRPL